jgi:hypothetical protein
MTTVVIARGPVSSRAVHKGMNDWVACLSSKPSCMQEDSERVGDIEALT